MRFSFLLSALAGLGLALLFVAGVGVAGAGALHLDLATGHSAASAGGSQYPTSVDKNSFGYSPGTSQSPSSLSALGTSGMPSAALVFSPIMLGLVLGGVFYGISARRTGA